MHLGQNEFVPHCALKLVPVGNWMEARRLDAVQLQERGRNFRWTLAAVQIIREISCKEPVHTCGLYGKYPNVTGYNEIFTGIWPEFESELCRPTERPALVGVVPTFADRWVPRCQRDGSLRQYSRLPRSEPLLFPSSSSSVVLSTEWTPFQTHYFSENLVAPESYQDFWICCQELWPLDQEGYHPAHTSPSYHSNIYFNVTLLPIRTPSVWLSPWRLIFILMLPTRAICIPNMILL
jgi:hypothetical protein